MATKGHYQSGAAKRKEKKQRTENNAKGKRTSEEFSWKMESSSVCSDLLAAQITSPEITDSTHSSALIIIKISIIFVSYAYTV